MYKKPNYEVEVLDWSEFEPVETQRWICAGGYDTFEQALKGLELRQNSYPGVRIVLADPAHWKDEI